MTDTTTDTTIIDRYFDMWNAEDEAGRRAAVADAWATDARYVDPMLEADGHDGLVAMVAGVQAQFPGHRFRRTTGVDAHHEAVRFGWELFAPDGTVVVAGIDVGELDGAGRLRRITGFFGEPPVAG
jgi:hypothetical protein